MEFLYVEQNGIELLSNVRHVVVFCLLEQRVHEAHEQHFTAHAFR